MIEIRSLGYVGVESPNFAAWNEVAPEVFAAQLAPPGDDGTVRVRLDDRDHRIAIHPGEQDRLAYLGWELANGAAMQEAMKVLDANGCVWTNGADEECAIRAVAAMISVSTPSGFPFELFYGPTESPRSFSPPRRFSGFVTGTLGLGHVVLAASEFDKEDHFLTQILGFRLTDFAKTPVGEARFYRVNPRHHSLAIFDSPGMRGLHHIMVQVNDIDDVGIALDRALARDDMPLSLTLGRHSTDRMLSFYVRTPSGFDVEYGWGAREVKDENWTVTEAGVPAEIFGHQPVAHTPPSTIGPAT